MEELIYFDNGATTYPKPECVYQAMEEANRHLGVNAARGSYRLAQKAVRLIEETREQVLRLAQAEQVAEVVFTPSATVACNQILGGLPWTEKDVVYVSPFEHNAIMRTLHHYRKQCGFAVRELWINPETFTLDVEKIRHQFLQQPPTVLIMTQVSNVTGYILPWQEVLDVAEQYQPVVILDGAQGFGLVPVSLRHTLVDFYIFAGHKTLYGPLGIGGYINHRGKRLGHVLFGGNGSDSLNLEMTQNSVAGYEPGSMNIAAIAGLHAALQELESHAQGELLKREQKMRRMLKEQLLTVPEVLLYPERGQDLTAEEGEYTGILSWNLEGYQAHEVGILLDEDYHIAVRTGYHCAPLIHKYLKDEGFGGTVRVSLGRFNREEEILRFGEAVEEIAES